MKHDFFLTILWQKKETLDNLNMQSHALEDI